MPREYDVNNIFAKIIRAEIPCNKVFENEFAFAFHDIYPAAPVHILVLPKKPYISFNDFTLNATPEEVVEFYSAVQKVAVMQNLDESGYRLITNHGADASQTVPHFHMHILGKRRLGALVAGDKHHEI